MTDASQPAADVGAVPNGVPGPSQRWEVLTSRVRRAGALRSTPGLAAYGRHHFALLAVVVVGVGLLGPRLVDSRSDQYLVNLWMVYSIAVVGFYWQFGLAGRFAFSQTFMMMFGAYTSAWFTRTWGPGWFIVGVLFAMICCGAVAALVGAATRRAQDFYFAIATLAVTQVGTVVFSHTTSFSGPDGNVYGIAPIEIFGKQFVADDEVFWVLLGVLAAILLAAILVERSPLRRQLTAGRDNQIVAEALGNRVVRAQIVMYAAGSAVGGLAGALLGSWTGSTSKESFGLDLAIGIFLMLLVGGMGSLWGGLLGAAFYIAVPRYLSSVAEYQSVAYGLLLLVVIIACPGGVVGLVRSFRTRLRAWSHSEHRRQAERLVSVEEEVRG